MTHSLAAGASVPALDEATRALVRLSARITAGTEQDVRVGLAECARARVSDRWVEELVLQSYLFAGFPRALNAAREWRRAGERATVDAPGGTQPMADARRRAPPTPDAASSAPPPARDGAEEGYASVFDWRTRGEETCEVVYGRNYGKLRRNIRGLHSALDDWMIVEGYGKVLARTGLDLARRELCVVAACAAAGQDRQLHSHLHGALNAGATRDAVRATIEALEGVVSDAHLRRAREMWIKVERQ